MKALKGNKLKRGRGGRVIVSGHSSGLWETRARMSVKESAPAVRVPTTTPSKKEWIVRAASNSSTVTSAECSASSSSWFLRLSGRVCGMM